MDTNKNVTFRKPYKTGSLGNLSDVTYDDEKTIFDTTMLSIPDSPQNYSDNEMINDLNEQIKSLKTQLMSAHQEIEDLNNENFRLKTDLQKTLKTVETCKKICKTPDRKNGSPLSARKTNSKNQNITSNITNNESIMRNTPYKKTNMVSKGTQTSNLVITDDKSTQTEQRLRATSQVCNIACEKTSGDTYIPRNKHRLSVISSNCTKGMLPVIEEVFSKYFNFCHYLLPNITTTGFMNTIECNLKDFTMNDYCLIFIGENDLNNGEYLNILENLRNSMKNINHTNIIICTPTYKTGALIHNYKVELFNNLLCLDIKNNQYAYFFDSNSTLSLEMFSSSSGKLNKYGWRKIFEQILCNILIDYRLFCSQVDLTSDKTDNSPPIAESVTEDIPTTTREQLFLL